MKNRPIFTYDIKRSRWKGAWGELRKHFLNIPPLCLHEYEMPDESLERLEALDEEIHAALKAPDHRPLFLLSAFGMGKTTQISSYLHRYRKRKVYYRSFLRLDSLQKAFFHLTYPWMQWLFFMLGIGTILLTAQVAPGPTVFPLIALVGVYFMKSFNQMGYLFQEFFKTIFSRKEELWILEDLDRCAIDDSLCSYFIANLWKIRRRYLITLGYPLEEPQKRLQKIETAIKLGGRIIEILPDEHIHFAILKKLDEKAPFSWKEEKGKKGWLSFFTLREITMVVERAALEMQKEKLETQEEKAWIYLELFAELLKPKLELSSEIPLVNREKKQLSMPDQSKLSGSQQQVLDSFYKSIDL